MRVLLAATNRLRAGGPPYPLGVALLAPAAEAAGHHVRVWDAMFQADWRASLRACLRDLQPDVVGLSVRNVDDQEIRNPTFLADDARQMAELCREETNATLVLGGAAASMFPQEMLAYTGAEYAVVGEGERAFPMLLDRLQSHSPVLGLPGAVWLEDGRLRGAPPQWHEPMDDMPLASRDHLDSVGYYNAPGPANAPNPATLQSKRGCPMKCIYCATSAIEGPKIRMRSPRRVVDEIERLAERGFRCVHFVDAVFTNPPHHARAICEELIRRRLDVQWSCTVNPATTSADLVGLMRRAGCSLVMVGNESGSGRILKALRKGFDATAVERAFAACRREGVRYHSFLLVGGPGEDKESVRESVDLMLRHRPDLVYVTVGIRIYPGCELERIAREEGALPRDADMLRPQFYLSPGVRGWIWEYLDPIVSQEPGWSY